MPLVGALAAALALQTVTMTIEVPFRLAEDAIIVDATVNGRKVSCMFDTGFGGTVVLDNRLNIGKPSGTMTLRDFVGEFEASTVPIKTLMVGQKRLDPGEKQAVMQPGADYSLSYGTHVDGILGFEAIMHAVTEINFEKSKFIFYPSTVDITKRKPDNKRTFLARLLPIGADSLEMEVTAGNGKKMILALDTGNAFYATTHRDVLERIGLWKPEMKPRFVGLSGVASGAVESWDLRMKNVDIFGVPVPEATWNIIDLPSSSADGDGTVGFGFLKNFNITIDYDRRRVWLENFTGKVGNEPDGGLGIAAAYVERLKRVAVLAVAPESPADKAGIKVGDHVLSVDGQELREAGFRRMRRMLDGKPDTSVRLVLSRNGQLMRHELKRAELVNETAP